MWRMPKRNAPRRIRATSKLDPEGITKMSNGRQGHGWIIFAGIMLILGGLSMLIVGLAVLGANQSVEDAFQGTLVVSEDNLDVWGWVYVILGGLVAIAGIRRLRSQTVGRVDGNPGAPARNSSPRCSSRSTPTSGAHRWQSSSSTP